MYLTGKLRSLIPYQPQYKRPEQNDEEANHSQCHHCDNQIRQVSQKKNFYFEINVFVLHLNVMYYLHIIYFVFWRKKMLKVLTNSKTSCIKKKSRIWDLQNTLAKFISLQIIIFRYFLQCFLWILKLKSKGMLQGSFLGHLLSNSFSELNMKTFFFSRKKNLWVNARYTTLHLLWLSYKCFV